MIGDRAVKSVVWDQLQHIGIIWEIKSFPGHKRLENWAEGSKKALPLIIKFGASRDYVALKVMQLTIMRRGMRWEKETKTEKKVGKRQKRDNEERRKEACAWTAVFRLVNGL